MYETTMASTEKQHHHSVMPLLSRIDRLETAMRRLEMNQINNVSSSSGCSTANSVSPSSGVTSDQLDHPATMTDMDVEHLKESNIKCKLLERIKTLENRLFQLKLRVESEKMEARTRRSDVPPLSSCSLPIFMMNPNNNNAYKKPVVPNASIINNIVESEAKNKDQIISSGQDDDEDEKPANKHQKQQKNRKTKKSKTGQKIKDDQKMRKKKQKKMSKPERENIKSLNWPHFNIWGC